MEKIFNISIERKRGEVLIDGIKKYNEHEVRKAIQTPIEPFKMEVSEGKKFFDIIGFQDTSNFAISERLYNLLIDHRITGWKGFEISINNQSEVYYGFQVLGRCGKLIVPKEMGFYTGYQFNYSTWDGLDFFSPDGTMLLFCSDKVRKLFDDNKITNVELVDINLVQAYSVGDS